MPLPKIDLPIFELSLLSVEEPVKFRPFLVKEEKLLLMALQTDDEDAIVKTIKQVINNCLVSNIDIDKLPIFDIEYLFLNIRARSIGEVVETYFVCKNVTGSETADDGTEIPVECGHMMPVKINLLEVSSPAKDKSTKIILTDKIGIQMLYPSLKTLKYVDTVVNSADMEQVFNLVYECSDYIFDESGMYYVKESDRQEFDNFMNSLTQEQFDKILKFFENLPSVELNIDHKCQKCGFDHKLHLEGLNDFFI
jgi:hypothetical protein